MADWIERRPLLATLTIVGAIILILGGLVAMSGGQTRQILSTVGAAVGPAETARQPEPGDDAGSSPGGAEPSSRPAAVGEAAVAPGPGLLIVRTGTLRLEVTDVGALVDRVTSIASAAGGYVAASKASGGSAAGGASIDLRVPAARWDATLATLRSLGTVRDQQVATEEVTGQVVDLDARVRNLRSTEAALQAIMAKAARIEDVLDVQEQLTETRGQIEQLVAKAANLRDRAAFGSLTVVLTTPPAPRPSATPTPQPPGWDPGRDARAATAKLVRIGQKATTAGIWLAIVGIPLLVSLAIGLGIVRLGWLVLRRTRWLGSREPI